ncbi:hypothetical protein FRB96_002150 [Tulasnella sp. 330]|nr:hypothetical protein FRB96_002150 [Tulasnella sp. 330]
MIATQTIGQLCRLKRVTLTVYDGNDDDAIAILLKMAELPALECLERDVLERVPPQLKHKSVPPSSGYNKITLDRDELGEENGSSTSDLKIPMTLAGEHEALGALILYTKHDKARPTIDMLRLS